MVMLPCVLAILRELKARTPVRCPILLPCSWSPPATNGFEVIPVPRYGIRREWSPRRGGAPRRMKNSRAGTWISQIEAARSARDLVAILRDYLGTMTPDQAAQLPDGYASENLSTAAEIQEWAVTLARADLKADGAEHDALREAAMVFTASAARLPRLGE